MTLPKAAQPGSSFVARERCQGAFSQALGQAGDTGAWTSPRPRRPGQMRLTQGLWEQP